jgi:hypothetical protein
MDQECREIEVPQRGRQAHPVCCLERLEQAGLGQARPRARVQRKHERPRHRQQQIHEARQANGIVDGARPMCGHEQEFARRDPVLVEHACALTRPLCKHERHVDHHVTDQFDSSHRALACEVGDCGAGRAQQQRADVIGEDPVDLLGHGAVE